MNIGYHYYTVKTLARKAGFPEEEAQTIAFYSEMVDDFVLSHKIILKTCPPDFFLENKLAKKTKDGEWEFWPCPTGIDFIRSVSHDFEKHTLAPFHFIPVKPLPRVERKLLFNRFHYRCQKADMEKDFLIVRIVREAVETARANREPKNLMRLGMALHTFADTYAHCNFSGLHGYENEAVVREAVKINGRAGICEAEILVLKNLPSIGHANIGTVPDICTYKISYEMRSRKKRFRRKKKDIVSRDNAQYFSECSGEIYRLLCRVTGKTPMNDTEWERFKADMIRAQTVEKDEKKYLTPSWSRIFPDITYEYSKNKYFSMELAVEERESILMENPLETAPMETLSDVFSCEGNKQRTGCRVVVPAVEQDFFDYNELAYERVKRVTGEYRGKSTF